MQTPEANAAKDRAWTYLFSSFRTRVYPSSFRKFMLMKKNNFSAEVFFKEGPSSLQSVFGSERRYWNEQMKNALGLALGFPFQLSPRQNKTLCQQRCQSLLWISRDNLIGACRVSRVNCRGSRVNRRGSRKLSRVRKIELLLFPNLPK